MLSFLRGEKMTAGKRIKKIRQEKGLSQKELGKKLGVSQQMIGQWEAAKANPQMDTLEKIANALNVPLYELMGFDGSIRANMNKQRPIDIAIQKYQNDEKLTEEEEQTIIEYVESDQLAKETAKLKQVAQKAYNYILYMHSNSYTSSEEEYEALLKQHQKQNTGPSKKIPQSVDYGPNNNIHKYDASIRVEIKPETIKRIRIENKILNGKENVTEEEWKTIADYYNSVQLQDSYKYLPEVTRKALENLLRIKTACDKLNEAGQEKVAEHAEMIAKIPEYQKKPDKTP